MADNKGEIVIYTSSDGKINLDTRLENETIWLTQDMMAQLFDTTVPNINMHIKNIYKEGELEENRTVKDFLIVRKEGNRSVSRNIAHYNLDMILSVGYRIKSKVATNFRKWATNVLKEHLTKGYTINEKFLKTQQEKMKALQTTVGILVRSMNNQINTVDEAKEAVAILDKFAKGLDLLDDFDHKTLDTKGNTKMPAVRIQEKEFLEVVEKMKSEFSSDVFAVPKDDSFSSSVNQIYQTFDGKELYPTLEEKAAMLLYLVTKNHSFSDGNKRIAASCFLYFLDKNGILYKTYTPIISNETLFALTLLIAESHPAEMETMKQVVVSILNTNETEGGKYEA